MPSRPPRPPAASLPQPSSTAVARLAGVSQSTVSRVFSAGAAVSEKVRERVMKAAAELNYRPNALPAILQTGRSGIIAVVMGGFYNPFFTESLQRVTAILHARRLETMLVETSSDGNIEEIVGDLSRYRIDGVISLLAIGSACVAQQLESTGLPIVAVNSFGHGILRTVSTDNRGAGAAAADLLLKGGSRRLAYLAGRDSASQSEREAGFRGRLQERQMPEPEVIIAGFSYEEGYEATVKLLSSGYRPDGIFCVDDLVAISAMDAIRQEFGLSIPEDIQVIGFDNIPMASWRGINLTTLNQDIEALALESVTLLADNPPEREVTIPYQLIERGTTRR